MDRRRFLHVSIFSSLAWKETSLMAGGTEGKGPVIVSAGRRVDAPDAQTPRFPPGNVNEVRQRIVTFFAKESPSAVVCSAACGTDLLVLEVARQARVMREVLLGAEPAVFRKESVTDRPGDWGEMFDEVMRSAKVEVLKLPSGQEGYLQTNLDLLDRAEALAKKFEASVKALIIWNGQSRGSDDVTGHFLEQAKRRGIPVTQISTL
jgi:hypothetical protein